MLDLMVGLQGSFALLERSFDVQYPHGKLSGGQLLRLRTGVAEAFLRTQSDSPARQLGVRWVGLKQSKTFIRITTQSLKILIELPPSRQVALLSVVPQCLVFLFPYLLLQLTHDALISRASDAKLQYSVQLFVELRCHTTTRVLELMTITKI